MSDVNGQRSNGLPKEWEWVKLNEVCSKIIGGGTPSTKEARFWDGDIPWISSADIEGLKEIFPRRKITKEAVEKSTTNILPKGGIIVVTRVGLGKIAIAPFDICFSQDSQGLILNEKRISQSYALIYLSKAVQKFKHESRGTTINGVTKKQLVELDIPLPPLSEQERITSKLEELFSELDKSIEDLKTAQQQLKVYRQSVLKYGTSGLFTSKNNKSFYTISIGTNETKCDIKGWQTAKLIDIAILESGHTPRKTKKEYWENGDVQWISLQDIREADGTVIQDTKYKTNKLGIANSSARLLPKGTVVFSRDISVGFVTIMGKEMSTTQHFANWICSERINNIFLMYCFMASRESLIHRGQGTTVKTIYMPELKHMQIQLPPLKEQYQIVQEIENRLSVADKVEETIVNSLEQAEALRQSILKMAFEGKLI